MKASKMAAAAQSTAASNGNSTMEKTANPDGSLSVKVATTNTLPNGSGEITTEYFQIPAHMASSVSARIDVGEPPSRLYLTRKEQRTLPAGTSQSPSSASASPHPTTAYPVAGNAVPLQRPSNQHDDRRGRTEAAMDEEETTGTGAGHEEVAILPCYQRKGFVYAIIAVTLVAIGVAVLAVVLPSNNKGPDQFTTKSELETAIWEYLEQGCPTDVNCQARSDYGGAVSPL